MSSIVQKPPKITFFTFNWKIENFSLYVLQQKKFSRIQFYEVNNSMYGIENDEYVLELRPIPNCTHCIEVRMRSNNMDYELSFHPFDDKDNMQRGNKASLLKDLHLPEDTLTVYCRVPEFPEIRFWPHLGRTIFLRETLLWDIETDNEEPEEVFTTTFQIDSLQFNVELQKFGSSRGDGRVFYPRIVNNKVHYEMTLTQTRGERLRSVDYEVTIMAPDKVLCCVASTKDFHSEHERFWTIFLPIVENELDRDLLTIQCEFTVEVNSNTMSKEQQAVSVSPLCSRSVMIDHMLNRKIPMLYRGREQELLDKILEYFPTDSVGELQLEWAAKLHCLVDKFNLERLKEKCLSISNACRALALAYSSEDADLMCSVLDYVNTMM